MNINPIAALNALFNGGGQQTTANTSPVPSRPDTRLPGEMPEGDRNPPQPVPAGAMIEPYNPDDERRKAISRGLAQFAMQLGGAKTDFLSALGPAMGAGVMSYQDTMDAAQKERRKSAKDALDQLIAEQRAARDQYKLDQTDRRLNIMEDRYGTLGNQGQAKIDLQRDRYNTVEEQTDRRLDQGDERIDIMRERARMDAEKLKNRGMGGKGDRSDLRMRIDIGRLLERKFKELGLDDPNFRLINAKENPDDVEGAYDKAKKQYDAYASEVYAEFGYGPDGRPLPQEQQGEAIAPPPAQNEAQPAPSTDYTLENPAQFTSQEEYDALPIGAIFIHPKDGKLYRKLPPKQ